MEGLEYIGVKSNEPLEISAGFAVRPGTFDSGIVGETFHGLFYTRKFTVKPDETVIDIGAHIGAFAVYAGLKGAKVYAYEPEKSNFELLVDNVERNSLKERVELFARAVTGDGRDVKFITCSDAKNTGGGWTERQSGNPEEGVVVPSFTFDEITKNHDQVDFLKMDCEGAEYEILMQASEEAIAKIQKIAMEWHGGREAFDGLRAFLKERGFEEEWSGDEHMGSAYFWRK